MKGIQFLPQFIPLVLSGQKTMTRRVIKDRIEQFIDGKPYALCKKGCCIQEIKPRYQPGEIVYVKDNRFTSEAKSKGKLQILNVRVERLQKISHDDCIAEGTRECAGHKEFELREQRLTVAQLAYSYLWDSISKEYPWSSNPLVFAYEFKPIPSSDEA